MSGFRQHMETFWYGHDLESVLPWLLGKKRGWKQADNKRNESRLRLLFTAMTRPSHLLCLAMRREAFGEDLATDEKAKGLRERGWVFDALVSTPESRLGLPG